MPSKLVTLKPVCGYVSSKILTKIENVFFNVLYFREFLDLWFSYENLLCRDKPRQYSSLVFIEFVRCKLHKLLIGENSNSYSIFIVAVTLNCSKTV